jgi:site-specific DNA-adenine methylase
MTKQIEKITFPYPGGKARLARELVAMMPQSGRLYLEPFAGRGNVFFCAAQILKFQHWQINDIQQAPFFRAIKRYGDVMIVPSGEDERTGAYRWGKIVSRCFKPLGGTDYKDHESFQSVNFRFTNALGSFCLRKDSTWIEYDHVKALEPYLTFNGGGYERGAATDDGNLTPKGMMRRVQAAHRIMNSLNVTITNWDWHKFTKRRYNHSDFIFVDPPYFGCRPGAYDCAGFDHPGLVKWLKHANFRWMLTEYRHDFYIRAFGEPVWTKEVQVSMAGAKRWNAVECVWTNYGTGSKSGRKGPSQP